MAPLSSVVKVLSRLGCWGNKSCARHVFRENHMKEIDLKAVVVLMNKYCKTEIDVAKMEGKVLIGDEDGELCIIDKTTKSNGGADQ